MMIKYDWTKILQCKVWFGWYYGQRLEPLIGVKRDPNNPGIFKWTYADTWKDRLWLVPRKYGQPHPQWWRELFGG
jgi:hypothetical protein